MITVDGMVESGECPCEVCSSQDSEEEIREREEQSELMDTLSNHMIDIILENPKKYLLKKPQKTTTVKVRVCKISTTQSL